MNATEKQINYLSDLRAQALAKSENAYAQYRDPADQKSREHYGIYSRVLMAMVFDNLTGGQASAMIDLFKDMRSGADIRAVVRGLKETTLETLKVGSLWSQIKTVWAEVKDADKVVEIVWAAPKIETTYSDGLTVPSMSDVLNEMPEPWEYVWRNKGRDLEDKTYLETAEIEANIELARKEIKGE